MMFEGDIEAHNGSFDSKRASQEALKQVHSNLSDLEIFITRHPELCTNDDDMKDSIEVIQGGIEGIMREMRDCGENLNE